MMLLSGIWLEDQLAVVTDFDLRGRLPADIRAGRGKASVDQTAGLTGA